jgi:hypothetical protein
MAETVTDGPAGERRGTLGRVGITAACLWLPIVCLLSFPQVHVATDRYHADWCGETDVTHKGFSCTDLGYSTVGALAVLAVIAATVSVYLAIRSRSSARPWLAAGISAILIASSWLILYEARYAV